MHKILAQDTIGRLNNVRYC